MKTFAEYINEKEKEFAVILMPRDMNTWIETNTNKVTKEKVYSIKDAKLQKKKMKADLTPMQKKDKNTIEIVTVTDNKYTGETI